MRPDPALRGVIAAAAARPVDPAVTALCDSLAKRFPAAVALIHYGSWLRTGADPEAIADFYVVVGDWRSLWPGQPLRRAWHAWLPPTIYFHTTEHAGQRLRAKVAILSLRQFQALSQAFLPSLWGRLVQPCRLIVLAESARADMEDGLAVCADRFWTAAADLAAPDPWQAGLAACYACEWRAERADQPGRLITAEPLHYRRLQAALGQRAAQPLQPARTDRWAWRRRLGRLRHLVHLIKAAATVQMGLDYLAWKIARHSGEQVIIRPWMRRLPVLAGIGLFIQLRRRGGVR